MSDNVTSIGTVRACLKCQQPLPNFTLAIEGKFTLYSDFGSDKLPDIILSYRCPNPRCMQPFEHRANFAEFKSEADQKKEIAKAVEKTPLRAVPSPPKQTKP